VESNRQYAGLMGDLPEHSIEESASWRVVGAGAT
jgi:hypothetical protein